MIPESIIDRPPSAELKPDQTDQDTLPPYEILDPIIEAYVEEDRSVKEIVAMGFDEATVAPRGPNDRPQRIQAPPGRPRRQDHAEGVWEGQTAADHE